MTTIRAIQDAVCAEFGISLEEMLGPSKKAPQARPRQVAMFLSWDLSGETFVAIGAAFKRHYSTPMNAVGVIQGWLLYDRHLAERVHKLERQLAA